jgi:hypothetical protein
MATPCPILRTSFLVNGSCSCLYIFIAHYLQNIRGKIIHIIRRIRITGKFRNVVLEKISWTDHVRNEEVLLRVSEQRNILHEIRKWKANWISHILRRNCLLKEVIEGKIQGRIEVTRRRGRRRKPLLDDLGDRRGYSHLKEEALDRTKWRNRFGRGCGPVV